METQTIKKRKRDTTEELWGVFLAFLAPFIILLAIFIGNGIYPFGNRSFLFSDMYHQYMPFFQEFLHRVKAGDGIAYSWNIGMGSNFLALYGYYLASPLHWLAFLFPQEHLMEFMSYLVIFKVGAAGAASFVYLKDKGRGIPYLRAAVPALFLSLFYALSGFVAAYNWNIMWLDCIVLAPLILLGLERLVKEGSPILYCVTLAFSIYTNFYISIMICLFLVIYYVYLFFTEGCKWRSVLRFAFYSLLAGGMAGILLIPEIQALRATDFGAITFPEKWEAYYSVLDVLARHCMGIHTERALEHWPNVYCGAAAFLLIPLFAINEEIPAKKRFGMMAMAGFFLLSFSVNGLDFIWHGLNYPDSLPGRQSFLYILLVLLMCYEALIHLGALQGKTIIQTTLGAAVFFLFVDRFVEVDDFYTWTWLLNLGFVTLYAILLYLLRTRQGKIRTAALAVAFVLALGEAAANMAITSVGTTSRTDYLAELAAYRELYERNTEGRQDLVRVEKFERTTKNDGALAEYPTASVFSSTMNSYVMDLYKNLGMRYSKVYYGYDGATVFTSALLNVEYLFAKDENYENSMFRLVDREGELCLFEAEKKLPFGYVAPEGYDLPEGLTDQGITMQNELVNRLGIEGLLFRKAGTQQSGDDVKFTAPKDGFYYGYVTGYGTKKIDVTGAAVEKMHFKDLKKGRILYLGELKKEQELTFTNGDKEDSTPKISVAVYRMDTEILDRALEVLSRQFMTDVVVDNTRITGKLRLTEAGRLILTVPYEKGWTLWVNGEETEPVQFGGAFLALDLAPGEYDIRLSYRPDGQRTGLLVSLGSILLFAAVCLLRKRRNVEKCGGITYNIQ